MAVSSTMLPLGTPLPALDLNDVVTGGRFDAKASLAGKKGLLVAFICNHCPYVRHVQKELVKVAHQALDDGFAVAAVCSNDAEQYPDDAPGPMRDLARSERWRFPYLHDATQQAAKDFHAACTPDLYLFDAEGKLAYRGQFDDSRPSNGKPVTGKDLRAALEALAEGKPVAPDQTPSIGCNIKWRAGSGS